MKLYIWHWVSPVSDSYHNDGALLVFAESLPEARKLAREHLADILIRTPVDDIEWMKRKPDLTVDVAKAPKGERVCVHPNAGCC